MNNNKVFRPRTMGVMRVLVTLVGLLWCALVSRADTHYVSLDGTNDSVNGYITWAGAATQIQWAINAAAAGETVLVSNGTYNLTNQIALTNNITVQSLNGTNVTIVNGNYPAGTNRCFYISNGVLDGLTVSNGYASGVYYTQGGGGIYIETGSVFNCFIYGNYCSNGNANAVGGGICIKGSGIVSNCTVLSNTVNTTAAASGENRRGGGIGTYNASGMISASRISGNTARNGGGIYACGSGSGIQTVTNCIVDGNQTENYGGGISANISGMVVRNCVISNNVSTNNNGGGVSLSGGASLCDSIIIGNLANSRGGGVSMGGYGATMMSNCRVTANTASNAGGGIYLDPAYWMNGSTNPPSIEKCVITGNVSYGQGAGICFRSSGGLVAYADYPTNNAIVRNCLISGNTNLASSSGGGGVYLLSPADATKGPCVLINCTITGNQSVDRGGGLADNSMTNFNGCGGAVINCIVYSNTTTGDDYDEVYNVYVRNTNNYFYSCIRPTAGVDTTPAPEGNITNDPSFVNQANNNYHLNPNSPCINTGTNQDWMMNSVDLDGRQRIRYIIVDMGAYERLHSGTICSFH